RWCPYNPLSVRTARPRRRQWAGVAQSGQRQSGPGIASGHVCPKTLFAHPVAEHLPPAGKPLLNGLFAKLQRRSDFRYRLLGAVEEEELPLRLGDQVESRPVKLSDRLCPVPASFLYIPSERVSGGHGASSAGVKGGPLQRVAWLWAAAHVVFDCG